MMEGQKALALDGVAPRQHWAAALLTHARHHMPAALGLGVALLGVVVLLAQSLAQVADATATPGLRLALLGGAAGFATTASGALPALVLRSLPQRMEDSMLGVAAGMMLAASAFSLLLPGLDAGEALLGGRALGAGVVVIGMVLGVLLMLGLDEFTPHQHDKPALAAPGTRTVAVSGCSYSPLPCTTTPKAWQSESASRRATWRWDLRLRLPLPCRTFRRAWPWPIRSAWDSQPER